MEKPKEWTEWGDRENVESGGPGDKRLQGSGPWGALPERLDSWLG